MKEFVFVIGGEKSGKSSFALREGENIGLRRAFIATAVPIDEEMEERIKRHRAERDNSWTTFEEDLRLPQLLERIEKEFEIILIDCLTIWVSNIMYHGLDPYEEGKKLMSIVSKKETNFIIISNEVGMGIVPENKLSRDFRKVMGTLNQKMAQIADRVVFLVAGIPIELKGRER